MLTKINRKILLTKLYRYYCQKLLEVLPTLILYLLISIVFGAFQLFKGSLLKESLRGGN